MKKAAGGSLNPQFSEYAWGTPDIASYPYNITNNFNNNSAITNYSSTQGNANTVVTSDTGVRFGSLRNGIFANSLSTRVSSGAGYYGAMELSGNLVEFCVTTANNAGRSYTGRHGNGTLTDSGYANEDYWPGINGNSVSGTANTVYGGVTGVTSPVGCIYRGGSYVNTTIITLYVSKRNGTSLLQPSNVLRLAANGIRGVHAAN